MAIACGNKMRIKNPHWHFLFAIRINYPNLTSNGYDDSIGLK
jgi:hypothetical protein